MSHFFKKCIMLYLLQFLLLFSYSALAVYGAASDPFPMCPWRPLLSSVCLLSVLVLPSFGQRNILLVDTSHMIKSARVLVSCINRW